MSITLTLSHDKGTLDTLRDEWIDLQTRSSATGMAITWQWIYVWYKHFDHFGELWIITARKDNRLIGIAPLMKVKEQPSRGFAWQQIEFIGASFDAEHLDFIIETGYEEQLIPLFIDKLYEHKARWDVIRLTALSDTKTPDILQQSDRDWIENPRKNMITVYVTLPDTMDDWMLSISHRRRKKLRSYLRKLDKQFPNRWSITKVTQPDELDETFEYLVYLHQIQWEAKGESGIFEDAEENEYYRELMHCLLEAGWLCMYRLDIDDKPCAIDFCYHFRGRTYAQIGAINRDMTEVALGDILTHHSINRAIVEGYHEYSFMLGEHPYKYSFGGVNREQQAFELIGSPRVQLQIKAVDGLREIKSLIRQLISNRSKSEVNED